MKKILAIAILFVVNMSKAQKWSTPFEKSDSTETTTYDACIQFYQKIALKYPKKIRIDSFGQTDAGKPLHLITFQNKGQLLPSSWNRQKQVAIFINNGIHPGEPDGIDASMLLIRDLVEQRLNISDNIILTIIPIYNIGGSLNRNRFSRVNQNGPMSYGFRGNAQNLDLNRDFIKSDSREAKTFAQIFHYINPDIFIDNHVSDGADYQHTMTLLTTHHSKLGGPIGQFLHQQFEPAIYAAMKTKNWDLCPYVNFEAEGNLTGWTAFYDGPRYSSGYAALFQTMAFVPETHMLKPFAQRVKSTYDLMISIANTASIWSDTIIQTRKRSQQIIQQQKDFPIAYSTDSTNTDAINFMGYTVENKISEVTGLQRYFYNHNKPLNRAITYYNYLTPTKFITKPKAYLIPQGWYAIIDLLIQNKVKIDFIQKDTSIEVQAYKIEQYKTAPRAYEKHYRHYDITTTLQTQIIKARKGDVLIFTGQIKDRFLIETLEPTCEDSYFCWNFFDAILQQKEGYSDYRWEDIAAAYLKSNPSLQEAFANKKRTDANFAQSASAQLNFIYKNSPYYEAEHMRYPIFRIL